MGVDYSELLVKARSVRVAVFDGDGVLFTGRVFLDPRGEAYKERSLVDGQGIALLRAAGIRLAIVSGENTGFVESVRDKLNSQPSVIAGRAHKIAAFTGYAGEEKVEVVSKWLQEIGVDWPHTAYMGDDLNDIPILSRVGFPSAPVQAERIVRDMCIFVSNRRGGDGAIRDLASFLLEAKEIDPKSLALK